MRRKEVPQYFFLSRGLKSETQNVSIRKSHCILITIPISLLMVSDNIQIQFVPTLLKLQNAYCSLRFGTSWFI